MIDLPTLVAGDSWPIRWNTSIYREVDGYSAELFFGLKTTRISHAGARGESDEEWFFLFPPATTAGAKPAGDWRYWLVVTRDPDRYTPEDGWAEILPNPSDPDEIPPLEVKRLTLKEALEARREIMSSPIHQSSFQGNTYTMADIEKLNRAIRQLEDEIGTGPGTQLGRKLVFTKFRRI